MPEHSYTSRRELDQYVFHPVVTVLAPLACLLLQVVLPRVWPRLAILDLPLIAVVFFAIARRNPIAGSVTGMVIGLFQDGLSGNHFGVFGIAKSIIGYMGSSIGFAMDMENNVNRMLVTFAFSLMQSVIVFVVERLLLGDQSFRMLPLRGFPLHELIRAAVNTGVALPLFVLLDRFRIRE
jgi:rod shape-determining protein MreD